MLLLTAVIVLVSYFAGQCAAYRHVVGECSKASVSLVQVC